VAEAAFPLPHALYLDLGLLARRAARETGAIDTLLADTGYFSVANVQACVAAEIDPLIAMGRGASHTIRRSPSASPRRRHRRITRRRLRRWCIG
jgi:IS5 family transposase